MEIFNPAIPDNRAKIQSAPVRQNFNAINSRTDQLTCQAMTPLSTTIYISSADKVYFNNNLYTPHNGSFLNLGDLVTGVYRFTNLRWYKEVIVFYYYDKVQNIGKVNFIEGFEVPQPIRDTESIINNADRQFKNGTTVDQSTVDAIKYGIPLCSILVQNNGIQNREGQINNITNDDILDLRPFLQKGTNDQELLNHINTLSLSEAHPNALIENKIIKTTIASLIEGIENSRQLNISPNKLYDGTEGTKGLFSVGDIIRIPTSNIQFSKDIDNSTEFITCKIIETNPISNYIIVDKLLTLPFGRLIIKGELTLDKISFDIGRAIEDQTSLFTVEESLAFDTNYRLSDNTVSDVQISSNANINRGKIQNKTPNFVIINDGDGLLSEEEFLSKNRGGAGGNISNINFPNEGTLATIENSEKLLNKKIQLQDGTGSDLALSFSSGYGLYKNNNEIDFIIDGNQVLYVSSDIAIANNLLVGGLINNVDLAQLKSDQDQLLINYNNHTADLGDGLTHIHHTHSNWNELETIDQELSSTSNIQFRNITANGQIEVSGLLIVNSTSINNRYSLPEARGTSGYVLKSQGDGTTIWEAVDILGNGGVLGPNSSTINAVCLFSDNSGQSIKSSGVTIDNSGNITANNLNGISITGLQTQVNNIPVYNQSLNTTNNVIFNNLTSNGILTISDQVSFFDGIPTTKKSLNSYTSDVENVSYSGTIDGYAYSSDLNNLRSAYENLREMCDNMRLKLIEYNLFG